MGAQTFVVGRQYRVVFDDDKDYIPCSPIPGSGSDCTRIPKNEFVTFVGMRSENNYQCLELLYRKQRVLIGEAIAQVSLVFLRSKAR